MHDFSASTQFLFDKFRSGRMRFAKGELQHPEEIWSFQTRSFPAKGPESSPVFDSRGNIFFGCHDGCFYSLSPSGSLRWMFKTAAKIYSSPLLISEERVCVASGDGYLHCFSTEGSRIWSYDLCSEFRSLHLGKKLFSSFMHLHKTVDVPRRRFTMTRCWSSPALDHQGNVLISGFGIGLHAVNSTTGTRTWAYDLGWPRYHLSGVATNQLGEIFVGSQESWLHGLTPSGTLKWKMKVPRGFQTWGNPSVDPESDTVFFPLGNGEKKGLIVATDFAGNIKWKTQIGAAIRGSVTRLAAERVVVGTLNGVLLQIHTKDGTVRRQAALTNARRGLWTSASIDRTGNIFVTTKDCEKSGSVCCLTDKFEMLWRYRLGKSLSVPVLDANARLFVGSWDGSFKCLQT